MSEIFDKISSEVLFSNPYWKYKLDKYRLPSGSIGDYHFIDSRGSSLIIPELDNHTFVMTNQFRYLNHKFSIEFPGGGLPEGVSFEDNVIKELEEETGYIAHKLELLGEFNPFNGVTNEICKVFLASELTKSKQKLDDTESISIMKVDKNDIFQLIKSNKIWDGMSISAYFLYHLKT
ncbi:MAG: hypothetical protein A2X64_04670 [Ignavibacteria bacterium GWF2_33_9]|nr:MAG: hypothetical protein A2X64_04670 [Ignavibacteria bacterium GWF2_33_9]